MPALPTICLTQILRPARNLERRGKFSEERESPEGVNSTCEVAADFSHFSQGGTLRRTGKCLGLPSRSMGWYLCSVLMVLRWDGMVYGQVSDGMRW